MVVKKTTSGRKTDIEEEFQDDAPMSKVLIRSMEAVDIFCDACWLEDGLSKNTLSAYRQDLNIFSTIHQMEYLNYEFLITNYE